VLSYTLGVRQIIVAVNKMDSDTVQFSEKRFTEIRTEISSILKKVGYAPDKITFVPISGWTGENLTEASTNMPWHSGPTLIDTIDMLEPPSRPNDKPLRIPVQDVFKVPGVGTIVTGRVDSGTLKSGQGIQIAPVGIVSDVKSIEMHHNPITEAVCGDNIGFNVRNLAVKDIKRGYVVGDAKNVPPAEAVSFVAQVIIVAHPSQISTSYTPIVDCHASHIACKFSKFLAKIDRRSGKTLEENPQFLKNGDCALIEMVPTKPMVVETFSEFPKLGRFAVRDMNTTVAVGIVKEVVKKANPTTAIKTAKKS